MFHTRHTVVACLCLLALASFVSAQVRALDGPAAAFTAQPTPLSHVYWHFLHFQRHLDRGADLLDQQGKHKAAQRMRTSLQKELEFSDRQIALLRDVASQMEQKVASVDAKAMPIIRDDREWLRMNGPNAGPPPGHSQVHAIQVEHEAVLKDAVAQLNHELGTVAAARLLAHIEKEFAPRVTMRRITPEARNPRLDFKSAPIQLEVQQ